MIYKNYDHIIKSKISVPFLFDFLISIGLSPVFRPNVDFRDPLYTMSQFDCSNSIYSFLPVLFVRTSRWEKTVKVKCWVVYCVQVPDGVHVPVAVRVLHYRGVRGARRNRPLLHGNCRRHLVRHRILFKVYVFCQFVATYNAAIRARINSVYFCRGHFGRHSRNLIK